MFPTKVVNLFGIQTTNSALKEGNSSVALQTLKKNKQPKRKAKNNIFFWNKTSLFDFTSTATDQELQEEFYGKTYTTNSAKTKMKPYYNQLELLKKYGTAKMVEQDLESKNSWWSFKFLKKFLAE